MNQPGRGNDGIARAGRCAVVDPSARMNGHGLMQQSREVVLVVVELSASGAGVPFLLPFSSCHATNTTASRLGRIGWSFQ